MAFRGIHEHQIDPKGRFKFPALWRKVLNDRFDMRVMVTQYNDRLLGFPNPVWEEIEKRVVGHSITKQSVLDFYDHFISPATECPVDQQGRIFIPPTLREYAGLEKDIVLSGMINKFSISCKQYWGERTDRSKVDIPGLLEKLNEDGIEILI